MIATIHGSDVVQQEFRDYGPKAQRALVRALNRGMSAGRTLMASRVAKDMGLKVGDVRSALRYREATPASPTALLATSLKRIKLIKFGARGPLPSRGKGRGVSYRLGARGRGRHPHAFLAVVGSGLHQGVFVRAGTGRLPIRELHGPSIGHVFARYRGEALARAREVFDTTLDHELARATRA